jgi:uncharacterized membrane protein YfcA
MDPLTAIIVLIVGLFAGIVNTIVGGGSLISVPLLIISGLPAHIAIGTNRFAMIFNSGVAAIDYHKEVKYEIRMLIIPTLFASIGSAIGANIVLQINEGFLEYVIAIFMIIMGIIIFYKKELGLKKEIKPYTKKKYYFIVLLSFVLGVYGGFYGAGVSTIFSFLFVSVLGISFLKSAGITRFIVTTLSVIAVLIFLLNFKIDFLYGILLAFSFILGAKIGVRLAVKAGNLWIRRFMIFLVAISSIKLIFF